MKNIASDFPWIEGYYRWIKESMSAKSLNNGWTSISTPFTDRHNDGITVYARLDNGKITLSDDGYIIGDLLADGVSLKGPKRRKMLDSFLLSYGVKRNGNEMLVETNIDDYGVSLNMFLQAMLAVNDMFMLTNPASQNIFLDDVTHFLDSRDIIFTPSFIAKGFTGLEFNFDFQIAGKKKEILINSFNSINSSNLSSFLFDWRDIKEARQTRTQKDVLGLAIINDNNKSVDQKFLDALSASKTEYILFSQRNSENNLAKLVA